LLKPAVLQLSTHLFVTICSSSIISVISVPQFILLWLLCCCILGNVPDTHTVQQGPSKFNRGHPPSKCTHPTVYTGRCRSQIQPRANFTCTWIIKTAFEYFQLFYLLYVITQNATTEEPQQYKL